MTDRRTDRRMSPDPEGGGGGGGDIKIPEKFK